MKTTTEFPSARHMYALKRLWTEAFGEPEFWDKFMEQVFSADHCLCILNDDVPVAALFILDCEANGQKLAYLYAVATDAAFRRSGLCRTLMEDTHAVLRYLGYAGTLLVPADEVLGSMYEKLGYRYFTTVREFTCSASDEEIPVFAVPAETYMMSRILRLREHGVRQHDANARLLDITLIPLRGSGCLLAASILGDTLHVSEFFGDPELAPAIVHSLHCRTGRFRMAGDGRPFAMCHALTPDFITPDYFGLAFD